MTVELLTGGRSVVTGEAGRDTGSDRQEPRRANDRGVGPHIEIAIHLVTRDQTVAESPYLSAELVVSAPESAAPTQHNGVGRRAFHVFPDPQTVLVPHRRHHGQAVADLIDSDQMLADPIDDPIRNCVVVKQGDRRIKARFIGDPFHVAGEARCVYRRS
ncbi:hypothetical protein [Mycobacterium hubeiense]|uniref:hypothetical protein n=1 Tax=Mycobacterium hubeiense TaxID=1867256 RepID=UPI0018ED1ED5|nr:hypothetical protein [Mycobacterium sp. QGD 101]